MKKKQIKKITETTTKIILELVAIILIWRGLWRIIDRYLIPIYPTASDLTGLIIGIVILLLIKFNPKNLL